MKLLIKLLHILCRVLVTLIPKKNVWIFGAWFGKKYSDNSKYLYEYVRDNSNDITSVWITKNKLELNYLRSKGVNAYLHNSYQGIYYHLVAKVACVSHDCASDLNSKYIGLNTKKIQLWHGTPLKKIGYDDQIYTKSMSKLKQAYLIRKLLGCTYDLIISQGEKESVSLSSAFLTPMKNIAETGFPRNDVFALGKTAQELKLKKDRFNVIYLPTFRGQIDDEYDLLQQSNFNLEEVDAFLDRHNIDLYIKLHPVNSASELMINLIDQSKSIRLLDDIDINESISNFDALITDYSSVMFDYVLSRKPVLFFAYDLDLYLEKERNFYYDYSLVTQNKAALSWSELLDNLINAKNGNYNNDFLYTFHKNKEGKKQEYSRRVYKEIMKRFYNHV